MATTTTEEDTMSKRVSIFNDALQHQIDLIHNKLTEDSKLIRSAVDDVARNLEPPYPIAFAYFDRLDETYHISSLGLIVQSCIMQLDKDLKIITDKEWQVIIDQYQDIPKESVYSNSGARTGRQHGTEDITISDDIVETCAIIGEYIHTFVQAIPRLKHSYGISYKIVACLAIIYTARKLEQPSPKTLENKN